LFYYLLIKNYGENILIETNSEDKRFINKFIKFMNVYLIIDLFLAIVIVIIGIISNLKYEYLLIAFIYIYYLIIKNIILTIYGFLRFLKFIIKIICHKTEEEKKINPVILNILITVIINMFLWGLNYI
jgi:hypothetical protein